MGADVIYTYRKLLPRMLVFIMLWVVTLFVPFMLNLPPWSLFWFVGDFAIFSLYICFEFRRASKLVKGTIDDVLISDLTKAIYWLSIVGSKKVPSQQFFYSGNVTKVVNLIGGKCQTNWDEILRKYRLPNRTQNLLILGGLIISPFGILLAQVLNLEFLSWIFTGLALLLLLTFSIEYKKGKESIEALVRSDEATKTTRWLAQELIFLASERAKKPLRVMLEEGNYSSIKIVGSIFGTAIAEIEPKGKLPEEGKRGEYAPTIISKEYKPTLNSKEKWEPLWLALVFIGFLTSLALLKISIPFLNWVYITFHGLGGDIVVLFAAIMVVSLPFIPIELFFRRKHLTSSIFVVVTLLFIFLGIPTLEWIGLSEKMAWRTFFNVSMIVLIAVFLVFLYFGFPFLKMILRGGEIKPSDLEENVRRVPARSIRKLVRQNEEVGQRFDFLTTLYSKVSIKLSEVPESVRVWVNEDAKQSPKTRYFNLREDSVSLTEMGESLARALHKKLHVS